MPPTGRRKTLTFDRALWMHGFRRSGRPSDRVLLSFCRSWFSMWQHPLMVGYSGTPLAKKLGISTRVKVVSFWQQEQSPTTS